PGAIFWMWISAFFGMAKSYVESTLGIHFRERAKDGSVASGPMYYIKRGLGWPWLAAIFAFFMGVKTLFSTTLVQTNSIALVLKSELNVPMILTGAVLAFLTWLVIIGGIKKIAVVTAKLSPIMVFLYLLGAAIIILTNIQKIPGVFYLIFKHSFNPASAAGGFAGATVRAAVRYGVARGIYSNEAGTGSYPIVHGAAQTLSPIHQGSVSMLGVFVDTLIINTFTAMAILLTGSWMTGLTSSALAASAFSEGIPHLGNWVVLMGSILFGYSTLIAWPYYGEQSFSYLAGVWIKKPFRWVFCSLMLLGTVIHVETVWIIGDILNGMMAIPNLIGILLLSGVVKKLG
ncbi:MAG: alanine/glycine:cation symporter family protein, partial [Fidelibacterota bacterium]